MDNNYGNGVDNNPTSNGMGTLPVNNMSNGVNMSEGNVQGNVNQVVNNMPYFDNVNSGTNNLNVNNSQIQGQVNNQNSFNGFQNMNNNGNYGNDELLRSFIGNNYDKITKNVFNVPGFFFSTFYLFYRKMFLYGILLFLINLFFLNVLKSYFLVLVVNVLVGFFVNKLYLYYANKEIEKLKVKYPGISNNELKIYCINKGGTSVGNIFLGFLVEFAITFVVILIMLFAGIGNFFR